jgi:ribosomal protein L12E/L44/L45/RPP1/RPP2
VAARWVWLYCCIHKFCLHSQDEFVTSLAALALYDGEAEITAANISTLLAASNNTVSPYWPGLFASLLKDGGADKLVFSVGGSGPAPAPVAGAAGETSLTNFVLTNIDLPRFDSPCSWRCTCQGGEEGGEEGQGRGG